MSGWLPGFRSSKAEDAEPQPFELVCECNVRHSGLRRKSHQRIVCRSCGAALFVLPRDAYPPPPDADRIRKKRKPKPEEPPREASSPERVSRHKQRRMEQEAGSSSVGSAAGMASSAFQAAAGTVGQSTRTLVSSSQHAIVSAARGFWSFWTPLRLAGLGVVCLVAAIAVWSIHARRIERAERELNPAIEDGLAALEKGEIPLAAERLQVAVEALDLLGTSDRHAESVRAAFREARALRDLASESLLGMLEQADTAVEKARTSRPKSPPPETDEPPPPLDADWVVRFEALYKNQWVVLEAPVSSVVGKDDEPAGYQVGFPIGIGPQQHPVKLRADGAAFDQLNLKSAPQTVVFGGRLQTCRYDEAEQTWRVDLEPESVFVWVSAETYRRLGFLYNEWHPQATVEKMLASQAQAIGVESLVKAPPPETPELTQRPASGPPENSP